MSASDNKRLAEAAFESWARGDGDVFGLLADDVHWTITGRSAIAGTYASRQQFLDEAIQPIAVRLAQPVRPTVRQVVAEGEVVVVLWDGHAVAVDGQAYDNTYSWHLRFEKGSIVEVTAFFDAPTLDELLERVSAPAE